MSEKIFPEVIQGIKNTFLKVITLPMHTLQLVPPPSSASIICPLVVDFPTCRFIYLFEMK